MERYVSCIIYRDIFAYCYGLGGGNLIEGLFMYSSVALNLCYTFFVRVWEVGWVGCLDAST